MAGSAPKARSTALAYGRQLTAVRSKLTTDVTSSFDRLDSWRSADIKRFASRVAPTVEAAMASTGKLTDAYLATFEAAALGTQVRAVGVTAKTVNSKAVRGTPTADVYGRVGPLIWSALSRGMKLDAAVRIARDRLVVLVATDLQLAKTHAARAVLTSKDNVAGFRRTVHGTCDLCSVTAHQQYAVDELMPIHPGCQCDIEPIYDDHRAVGVTTPHAPTEITSTKVVNHSEIGPLLMAAAWTFTRLGDAEPMKPVTGPDAFRFEDEDEEDDE